MDYFYRFRSADALLGPRKELERQEIFLAAPESLNDPMEGFKDIYWKGDSILWKNFLHHYVLCVMQATTTVAIAGEQHIFRDEMFIFSTEDALPSPRFKALFRSACDAFFNHETLRELPQLLASRHEIRRDELLSYVTLFHHHALFSVRDVLKSAGWITGGDDITAPPKVVSKLRELIRMANVAEKSHRAMPSVMDEISGAVVSINDQLQLMAEYNGAFAQRGPAWRTLVIDFPRLHINALERLLYGDWYTACFVGNPSHAAMWGTYGHEHRGICLKFRAVADQPGRQGLMLRRTVGYGGGGPLHGDAFHQFHKVKYQDTFVAIDFFRALGRLNQAGLRFWAADESGQMSERVKDVLAGDEAWRAAYWESFVTAITTKSSHWAHEAEHRLVLQSPLSDFSAPADRALKYRFSDLAGVLFGIKTLQSDKLAIMKIIEAKCRAEKRDGFDFAQAYYSHATGKVEAAPLSLLKFEKTVS